MIIFIPSFLVSQMAMIEAIVTQQVDDVIRLLNNGYDIHTNSDEALCTAVRKNNLILTDLFLRHGADPDARDGYPMLTACIGGYTEVAKVLLMTGASCPEAGKFLAQASGHTQLSEILA